MYCLPFHKYVMGVAWALAGNSTDHNSLPVSTSKARRCGSFAAAVKISPAAVVIGPPRLGDPAGQPSAIMPNGDSHRTFPDARSNATTAPHGGALHGCPFGATSHSRYIA